MKRILKYIGLGTAIGITVFLVFGVVTALFSNPFFARMVPKSPLDYFFLITSSLLIGAYTGVHYYKKNTAKKCNYAASGGAVGGFLAFACPVCNQILLLLFGAPALMAYFEPVRPFLGFLSVGLLSGALYVRVRR